MAVYALEQPPRGPFIDDPARASDVRPAHTPRPRRRRRREVETADYIAFARRILRALSRRTGADLDTLGALNALREDVDGAITDAVARLRNDPDAPASWAEIGEQLAITRASAQQRFAKVGGARRPGGQPAHLR